MNIDREKSTAAQWPVPRVRVTGDCGTAGAAGFTTATGYASLLIAQNQAFVSFGLLAVLGEVTCIVAAIVSLPALLLTFSRRKV